MDIWNNFKRSNIGVNIIIGEEKKKRAEKIFEEIMARNFQNLVSDVNLQILPFHEPHKG